MQPVLTVFRKEVNAFLGSLIAYIFIGVFLAGVGQFMWMYDEYSVLTTGYATLENLFFFGPFFFLFLAPAITMRAFAEEWDTGAIEFLTTKPLTDWQILLGKYLAALFLVFFALAPTLIYGITIYYLGDPPGNLDLGATIGSYLGLFCLGAIFAAIGMFASALTNNQIVAFVLGLFLCFVFFMAFDLIAGIKALGQVGLLLLKLSINNHYQSISRGVIDSRDVLYFISFVAIALIGAKMAMTYRKG